MPFGLTNAPATFQAFINNILRQHLDVFVTVYLDDIVVYSETLQEHKLHISKVLEALTRADLQVKPEKTEFHKQEIEFLGFIVGKDGIKMDPKKVEAVTTWPTPKSVKDIQSFLGFANFYRRFIKNYSKEAEPLTQMTRKDTVFEWGEKQQQAFKKLQQAFITEPVLVMYNPEKPLTMETDASDKALGACISQPDEHGILHPIAFHSRKFSSAELNYEIHNKELAIVDAFKQWRTYLKGVKHSTLVLTDHKNLTSFTTTKVLNRRQVRWSEELSQYNFLIKYRKGIENGKADSLSRRSDYQGSAEAKTRAILAQEPNGNLTFNRQIASTIQVERSELDEEIKRASTKDSFVLAAIEDKNPDYREGYLWFKDRIYLPVKIRNTVLEELHGSKVCGHFGREKTLARLKCRYFYPHMRKSVEEFVDKCDVCKQTKHERHQPYGKLRLQDLEGRP